MAIMHLVARHHNVSQTFEIAVSEFLADSRVAPIPGPNGIFFLLSQAQGSHRRQEVQGQFSLTLFAS